jgi:hypothetical protein
VLILLDTGDIDKEGNSGEVVQSKHGGRGLLTLPAQMGEGFESSLQIQVRAQLIGRSACDPSRLLWSPDLSHDLGSGEI